MNFFFFLPPIYITPKRNARGEKSEKSDFCGYVNKREICLTKITFLY